MKTKKFKPTEKEIKDFLEKYSYSQKEVKNTEGFGGSPCAVSEMAINFGYVWLFEYHKWIKKDNASYTNNDEKIVEYLRENDI